MNGQATTGAREYTRKECFFKRMIDNLRFEDWSEWHRGVVAVVSDGTNGNGCGKTYEADAIEREYTARGSPGYARRIDTDDWIDRLRRECYRPDEWGCTTSVEKFIAKWTTRPTILFLDEVDKARMTEDTTAHLCRLIRKRHERPDRLTVLLTNWTMPELVHLLGKSVHDRITESYICDWPSLRHTPRLPDENGRAARWDCVSMNKRHERASDPHAEPTPVGRVWPDVRN